MKRATQTKQEIARQLIAQYHQEQEALTLRKKMDRAQAKAALRPRCGPKEPVFLPYKENEMFY